MGKPSVILGFPYRATQQRSQIFAHVREIVSAMYPFDEVIERDSGHPTFNRAASRNQVAAYAWMAKADAVVICDADSIPERDVLKETIDSVLSSGELRIPFDLVKVLPYNRFLRNPNQYSRVKPIKEYGPSCGGIYIFRPHLWITVGGMDERIEGWGYEDQIFLAAVNTYAGGPIYHVGNLYNIDHPRDLSSLNYAPNRELVDRYHAVEGKPNEFKAVAAGSNSLRPDKIKT